MWRWRYAYSVLFTINSHSSSIIQSTDDEWFKWISKIFSLKLFEMNLCTNPVYINCEQYFFLLYRSQLCYNFIFCISRSSVCVMSMLIYQQYIVRVLDYVSCYIVHSSFFKLFCIKALKIGENRTKLDSKVSEREKSFTWNSCVLMNIVD